MQGSSDDQSMLCKILKLRCFHQIAAFYNGASVMPVCPQSCYTAVHDRIVQFELNAQ